VTVLDDIRVIDTDTHVTESPDLWTSRMSAAKWGDAIPHLKRDEASGEDCWFIRGQKVIPVGMTAPAGHTDYVPNYPKTWEDLEPASHDANERLKMMDRYHVDKQILFANVALFAHKALDGGEEDKQFTLECIQAYNDFQTDWCSAAPSRLIAMTQIPFWDIDASIREMERGAALGHKGVVITQEPAAFGLPRLRSTHWDRLWAAAQDMRQPVNFHIASADIPEVITSLGEKQDSTYNVTNSVCIINGNLRTLGELTAGGICHRFPDLDFVMVESGFGWIPWALEAYDWQWKTHGVARNHPYELLPSPASTSSGRSTAVSGSRTPPRCTPWSRSATTTSSGRPTTRTRPACPRGRPRRRRTRTTTSRTHSRTCRRRPCARSFTTTPRGCTTSTETGHLVDGAPDAR
jgi:predicted TIM-barrel fold metal-dependent hydrolase